jgi:hypothetical protein
MKRALLIAGLMLLAGSPLFGQSSTIPAPTFSPATGTCVGSPSFGAGCNIPFPPSHTPAQLVAISDTVSGATVCYTTDGTTPTESGNSCTNGSPYVGPVMLASGQTLKALATKSAHTDSSVTVATFTVNYTVASEGMEARIIDGAATGDPCQAGGGSVHATCRYNGSTWDQVLP